MRVGKRDLGRLRVEAGSNADNLAIVLCSYFSRHNDRPEDDEETEDNNWWGSWVESKTAAALEMMAEALSTSLVP